MTILSVLIPELMSVKILSVDESLICENNPILEEYLLFRLKGVLVQTHMTL